MNKSDLHAYTWHKDEMNSYNELFHTLRQKQFENTSDRLHKNYSVDNFANSVAFSIVFNHDTPVLCSSISIKSCWPKKVYRIFNRLWKPENSRIGYPKVMSASFGFLAKSQVQWLEQNTDCMLYFISRETQNWEKWVANQLLSYNLEFNTSNYKYLTCENLCDDSCWQSIIYHGDATLLDSWTKKIL